MDRVELEQVSHTKFLGIVIDEQLDWTQHIKCCNKKVSSTLFALRSARPCLSEQTSKLLYYTLVYPHLSNGLNFWGQLATLD